jgi:hypothetical protein
LISALASLGLVFLTAGQSVAAEARPVALELVLAVDVSASVDAREYALQRDGIVAAFRDPRLTETIESLGPQGLAVSLVQWAASWEQAVVVDWTLITGPAAALRFAEQVAGSKRLFAGEGTSLSSALHFSGLVLAENGFLGLRRIVDVSGDGQNNSGAALPLARDQLIDQGITINGLAVLDQDPHLGDYYASHVMGGTASFVVVAVDYSDYAEAILKKLLRELPPPVAAAPSRGESNS